VSRSKPSCNDGHEPVVVNTNLLASCRSNRHKHVFCINQALVQDTDEQNRIVIDLIALLASPFQTSLKMLIHIMAVV